MRVLLTGASGFLGQYVLEQLRAAGIDALILGRRCPENHPSATFVEIDLLDQGADFSVIDRSGATHLLHLAWYAEHGKYWSSPLNPAWVEATAKLVERFCRSGGERVVVAGTCAEYEWSAPICFEDETPLHAATLYGQSKNAAHERARSICAEHGARLSWGRIFLPYGKGETPARLIPSLIDVFRGRREAFGINAGAYRDLLHVSDVAAAFLTLLKTGEDRAYNISSGQGVLLSDLVKMLAELTGGDPSPILALATERPGEPTHLVGDNSRLKMLGWQPKLSLRDGLIRTLSELS